MSLNFTATLDNNDFRRRMQQINDSITGTTQVAQREVNQIDNIYKKLGGAISGYLAFNQFQGLAENIVKVRGEYQQLDIAFTTMLKSKSKADKLMSELITYAADSPLFGLTEVAQGAKQLIAYGSAAETVTSEIKMLGDVSAGVSSQIGDLIYLYGTLRSQGRAYTVDIRQFASRGIPIYEELAKVLKINTSEVNSFVEAGKVGFKEVEQAFKNMTSNGGIFEGLTEKQSKSLTGMVASLKDALDRMYNDIGKSQEGFLADVIKGTTSIVDNYQQVVKILTTLIGVYGAYKAAVIAVNTIKTIEGTSAGVITAGVNSQSGGYAREIALKVKSAQASANRATAIAIETKAQADSALATVASMRVEVSALAIKKQSAVQAAKTAAAEIVAAKAKLTAAQQELAANATTANSKRVQTAQNALLIASENGVAARKIASARASEFNAAKSSLEVAAKKASTLTIAANSAASAANTAVTNASAVASTRLTVVQSLQIAVTRQLAAAQAAFNASLLSNPVVLFTVSIAALAGAMWYLTDSTSVAERAQKEFNDTIEEAKKKREDLLQKVQSLTAEINNETSTRFSQLRAYKELQDLFPTMLKNLTLQEFKTLSAENAQRKLNEAVDNFEAANLSNQLAKANKNVEDLEKKLANLNKQQGNFGGEGLTITVAKTREELEKAREVAAKLTKEFEVQKDIAYQANTPVNERIKRLEAQKESLEKQRKVVEAILENEKNISTNGQSIQLIFANWSLDNFNRQIKDTAFNIEQLMKGAAIVPSTGGDFKFWTDLKKVNEEAIRSLGVDQKGSKEWNKYAAEIRKADKALEAYNLSSKKGGDKPAPFGSLNYLEKAVAKIKEALGLVTDPNSQKTKELIAARIETEKKLADFKAKLERDYADGSVEYYRKIASDAAAELNKISPANTEQIAKLKGIQADANKKAAELEKKFEVQTFEQTLEEKKKQYELYNLWVRNIDKETADKQFAELLKSGGTIEQYLKNQIEGLRNKINVGVAVETTDYQELVRLESELEVVTKGFEKYQQRIEDTAQTFGSFTEQIDFFKAELAKTSPFDLDKILFLNSKRQDVEKQRQSLVKDFLLANNSNGEATLAIQKKYNDLRLGLDKEYNYQKTKEYENALNDINKAEKQDLEEQGILDVQKSSQGYKELTQIIDTETRKQLVTKRNSLKKYLNDLKQSNHEETKEYKEKSAELKRLNREIFKIDTDSAKELINVLGQAGQILSGANGQLGEFGRQLAESASQAILMMEAMRKGATTTEIISSVSGIVLNIISKIVNQKKEEQRLNNSILAQQNEYNNLLTERIRLQTIANGNGFTKDYKGIISDANKAAAKASADFTNAINTITNAQGEVVHRVGGFLGISLFGGSDVRMESVIQRYPDLIDGAKGFNTELAQTLLNSEAVTDAEKVMLKNALDAQEQLKEAQEQINDVIDDLVGSIGNDLRNALVDAFRNGTDAAKAFGETVGKVMENIIAQMLFSEIFGQAFDELRDEFKKSAGPGGDGNFADDLQRFFEKYPELVKTYTQGLSDAQKIAQAAGVDIFKNGSDTNSLSGSIKSLTEETGGVIAGQMNAIRITQAVNLEVNRNQLLALTKIANNSDFLPFLESIDKRLGRMESSSIRSTGLE